MTVALLVVAFITLPLIVFRGKSLARYFTFEAASYALGWILWSLLKPSDTYFAIIVFAVLKLAAFSLALANAKEVRWSATRAMAIAAIVYAFVIAAQMRQVPDGDEPFYLLITESLVKDHDRDLSNQYRDLAHSATRRTDLQPQIGDLHGPHGEQYSRLEPFLPIVMIPGYKLAGLAGALATIALLGVLLVRQTIRLLEDEGIEDATIRALFPLFAFAPPIVFFAARIWPEVPGALAFVEAVRGVRQRRIKRAVPAMLFLGLLKVRFVLIDLFLVLQFVWSGIRHPAFGIRWRPRMPDAGCRMLVASLFLFTVLREQSEAGFFGLFLDGMSGILFQAPFYLLGVFALLRWREMPAAFRIGIIASLPYIVSLVPRAQWHGGWSPPLRYITVFMPILFLGAAAVWQRSKPVAFAVPAALWTIGLVIHGLAFPWRLFHIENGENYAGEWLSTLYHADFSRIFPSFIRINQAALIASIAFVIALVLFRFVRVPQVLIAPLLAIAMLIGFRYAVQPANAIEFEDAHVIHNGGSLYPEFYTVERFFNRSGWTLKAGESMSFLARAGTSRLEYATGSTARIELDGREYKLPGTRQEHLSETVYLAHTGRVTLRCLDGSVSFDRMRHE